MRQLMWGLPFLATFLPILLLSLYAWRIATQGVTQIVHAENLSATSSLAQLLTQEITRSLSLAHAVGSIPGTVQAVRERDTLALRLRLKALVLAEPQVARVYLTDVQGVLLGDYPLLELTEGADLSGEEWFQVVMESGKPFVSGVVLTEHEGTRDAVIRIAVPIQTDETVLRGVLVFEYRAVQFKGWLQSVRVTHGGNLFVLDGEGSVIAHPYLPLGEGLASYREVAAVHTALAGKLHTTEYDDPVSGERMIATFVPVSFGPAPWVIVAQQPTSQAYAELRRVTVNIGLAGGLLTLVTLLMVVALARMSAKILRLNAVLKDITSIVSHQLKAPVTAMRWTLESILDGDYGAISDDLRASLRELHSVTVQNIRFISDILNVSRLDRGVLTVEVQPVKLSEVVERAARDYRRPIADKGLELCLEGMEQDITVRADQEKFAEAISNSVSNALKHTVRGLITVKLSADRAYGYVAVIDTGEGLSPQVLRMLFTREGIVSSSASPDRSTGFGLYIAREFMQLQGGDVTATSELGKGSTFLYKIPLAL